MVVTTTEEVRAPAAVARGPRGRPAGRIPLVVLLAGFAASRLGYALAGVRFDATFLGGRHGHAAWQLLDLGLLRHDLLTSVWHLHSQPPLFNLYAGALLKLPAGLERPVAAATFLAFGLVLAVSCYLLLVEVRVPRWVALVLSVAVMASPQAILYENWFFYAYPSAALVTLSALLLARYVRTRAASYGLGFFAAASAVVLLNSTFQVEWLVVALAVVVTGLRRHWRAVLAVAAVPLLVVVAWYAKDAAMFATYTTSSWLGMNLTRTTLSRAPLPQLRSLVRSGALTPIALLHPFGPVRAYKPRFVSSAPTGVPALDQTTKASGQANLNNLAYVEVARLYLHDDLAWIAHDPASYAYNVTLAARMFALPPDQYAPVEANRKSIAAAANLYDRFVLLQPRTDLRDAAFLVRRGPAPGPNGAQLPWGTLAVGALALLGAPVLAWRRRRSDRALSTTLAYVWLTVAYSFVVTSLVELGENNRFRFELGPLPLVAATAVVVALAASGRERLRGRRAVLTGAPVAPRTTPELGS